MFSGLSLTCVSGDDRRVLSFDIPSIFVEAVAVVSVTDSSQPHLLLPSSSTDCVGHCATAQKNVKTWALTTGRTKILTAKRMLMKVMSHIPTRGRV